MDLFDSLTHEKHELLKRLGWTEAPYAGGPGWLAPDKKSLISEAEGLRLAGLSLQRQQKGPNANG